MVEIKSESVQETMQEKEAAETAAKREGNEKSKAGEPLGKEETDKTFREEETDESNLKGQDETGDVLDEKAMHKKSGKKRRDKKEEKIEELTDRLMRNMAEFENFRKRSEKEKSTMFEIGTKSVIEKILPIVDNLERGFDALSDEEREEPFVKGIEQVYKQFLDTLDGIGVKPIIAVGEEFDPELHNAVMHDEDENFGENTVSQELQKGYMYKDSVVRHSMVKVSN